MILNPFRSVPYRPGLSGVFVGLGIIAVTLLGLAAMSRCTGADPAEDPVVAGKRLFREYGCMTCHRVGEMGGSNGPNLTRVGAKYIEIEGSEEKALDFFVRHILDPDRNPGVDKAKYRFVQMPKIRGMTREEAEKIARYLLTLRG